MLVYCDGWSERVRDNTARYREASLLKINFDINMPKYHDRINESERETNRSRSFSSYNK